MRIEVNMTADETKFRSDSWWAHGPQGHEFVVETLRAQLAAAAVIWPELEKFAIVEKAPGKARGGAKGGHARAEALPAERRQEIAKSAADARWGKRTNPVSVDSA